MSPIDNSNSSMSSGFTTFTIVVLGVAKKFDNAQKTKVHFWMLFCPAIMPPRFEQVIACSLKVHFRFVTNVGHSILV